MMMTHKCLRPLAPTLSAVAVAALAACGDEAETPTIEEALQDLDYIIMVGMENVLTKEGVRSGIVVSDSSYIYEDSSTAQLFGVEMTLFTEQGVERSRLTAERGWLNERTDELTAVGDVVLEIPADGRRIETPELHYDPVRDEISSDSTTIQVFNGTRTRATCGFQSDLQFRNFRLCGPVGDIPTRRDGGG